MSDLIDRQAAIDALRKMQTYKMFSGDDMLLIDQAGAMTELMLLPSAEPKRIKGKWITDKQGYVTWSAICNKCGERTEMLDGYYNFCPHCGADMREVTT